MTLRPGGLLELSIQESSTRFSSRVISEGTLRILGLLAITSPREPVSVVGYEEPENGVHPRRQKLIAELFAKAGSTETQYLINTHSPFVVEALRAVPGVALLSCGQDETGNTHFKRIDPLFSGSIVDRVLEGEFGG
ncbi:MAG: ATP-binding protein [Chloroflexi bacterium]|nr:ATP-binding protein [Chloroflexota bacterium]